MSKQNYSHKVTGQKVRQYTPVVVYFGTFGFAFLSYVAGRIALDAYPHPIHWASGVVGAVVGCAAGWLWFRWRGDII
jgi:hypothetical protein